MKIWLFGTLLYTILFHPSYAQESRSFYTFKLETIEYPYQYQLKVGEKKYYYNDSIDIQVSFKIEANKLIIVGYKYKGVTERKETVYLAEFIDGDLKIISGTDKWINRYYVYPYFFKTGFKSDPILIIFIIGHEELWGMEVFSLYNDEIESVGFISVAHNNLFVPENPVPYTEISISEGRIEFTFTDVMVHDPNGVDEYLFSPDELKYVYENKRLYLKSDYR